VEIPAKYHDGAKYEWRAVPGRRRSGGDPIVRLYNIRKQMFVIKNPATAGKPRKVAIAGNMIWEQVHEQLRVQMTVQMKNSMRPYVQQYREQFKKLKYPVEVRGEIHTTPKYCNWDLSNLWIYNKVFEDLLKGERLIPDDCVKYITLPFAPKFVPIRNDDERKLVFIFETDKDPRIVNHLMFNLEPKVPQYISCDEYEARQLFKIVRQVGPADNIVIDEQSKIIYISVGVRKILAGSVVKMLDIIYWECIRMDEGVVFENNQFEELRPYILKYLSERGIPVFIVNGQATTFPSFSAAYAF
jgi:hypothetical protein